MSKPVDPRKALGRGLSSLLPGRPANTTPAAPATANVQAEPSANTVRMLPLSVIAPNPTQPRTSFQADKLHELAESIKANGILQPILVRRKGESFEIVAGERRWRAAKLANLTEVPVLVQDIADDNILTLALIENIQRDDLNPIETAIAFDRLNREINLTHDEIGRRTGKDRTTITNFMRLLRLPQDLQIMVAEHRLSMGHAKALLALPSEDLQRKAAEKVVAQGLSVRATERLVQSLNEPREPNNDENVQIDPNVRAAEENLERILGTRVRIIAKNEKRGRIEIEYYSPEELDRLYQTILGEN
jgi:ParB family chromosome partitioning protein